MVPRLRKGQIPLCALGRHGCAREKGAAHVEGTPVGTEAHWLKRTHGPQEDCEEKHHGEWHTEERAPGSRT